MNETPECPRCEDAVNLQWTDWGYRCPDCYLFVALPKVLTPTDRDRGAA